MCNKGIVPSNSSHPQVNGMVPFTPVFSNPKCDMLLGSNFQKEVTEKMSIYAIKAPTTQIKVDMVYESLRNGEGRFGWSYVETADLLQLRNRIESNGRESLSTEEKDCYENQTFLLELQKDDYVVYVNVPEWGKCTLARITGSYEWRWEHDDFNHRFPVDRASVQSFDRNSAAVPAALSARLKLRGRSWPVYAEREFNKLLDRLPEDEGAIPRTWEHNMRDFSDQVRPLFGNIADLMNRTHPGKDLESLMKQLFERVPGVGVNGVTPKQGGADHGADLIVDFEFVPIPGLVQTQTLAVQVKSFSGQHKESGAVEDLERAFCYYEKQGQFIHMGLVVSTATEVGDTFRQEVDKLSEKSQKPVSILAGADLVAFFLRYGADLMWSNN